MKQDSKRRQLEPQPSVPDPRRHLLRAVLAFVRAARSSPGVLRIALLGSLATDKPVPKDADLLVTIDAAMDLSSLARFGRRLKGTSGGTAQRLTAQGSGPIHRQGRTMQIDGAQGTCCNRRLQCW